MFGFGKRKKNKSADKKTTTEPGQGPAASGSNADSQAQTATPSTAEQAVEQTPSLEEVAALNAPSNPNDSPVVAPPPAVEKPPVAEPGSDTEPLTSKAEKAEINPDKSNQGSQRKGFFSRIKAGLSRTRSGLTNGLADLLLGKKAIDDELLEELETQLLMADVGVEATQQIIDNLTQRVARKQLKDSGALYSALKEELAQLLGESEARLEIVAKKPFVILVVGVNGVGKTTTIGKLAKRFQNQGHSLLLAAGDTFRAAAVEQLQVWGERNQVPVVAQHTGADSASVIFDAIQSAQAREQDIVIADTAGRLHNKDNLMGELQKVVRVMKKLDPSAPHEVMLVLDATTGQNAINQASQFQKMVGVTGISLTKLDGTAKGGVIFAIAKQLKLPVRFIGVGEGIEDLRPFEANEFIEALFAQDSDPTA